MLLDFKDKMIEIAEEEYGVDIKKIRHQTIRYYWLNRECLKGSLNKLYEAIGISKQGVHKVLNRFERNQSWKDS